LDAIPPRAEEWDVPGLKGAAKLSHALRHELPHALLFRRLATLERDVPVGVVDDWRWSGPHDTFTDVCARIGDPALAERARRLSARRP